MILRADAAQKKLRVAVVTYSRISLGARGC
jgi:hypothetical protein